MICIFVTFPETSSKNAGSDKGVNPKFEVPLNMLSELFIPVKPLLILLKISTSISSSP